MEGEKASLERIIQSDLLKKKKSLDNEEVSEGSLNSSGNKKSSETMPDGSSRSPVDALDELIAALGQLSPSTEEVIAKLRNQVTFLIQVSFIQYNAQAII